jgi:hypothetical protein
MHEALCRVARQYGFSSCSPRSSAGHSALTLDTLHVERRAADQSANTGSKGELAARVTEIAQAHPEAGRFEIWSQDEAPAGQNGRTGYVWRRRGHTHAGCSAKPDAFDPCVPVLGSNG